jgi:hypothetical protein
MNAVFRRRRSAQIASKKLAFSDVGGLEVEG